MKISKKTKLLKNDNTESKRKIVEKILYKRNRHNKIEYYIKWKHLTEKNWKAAEDLDCNELIEMFEKKLERESCKIQSNKNLSLRKRQNSIIETSSKKRLVEEWNNKEDHTYRKYKRDKKIIHKCENNEIKRFDRNVSQPCREEDFRDLGLLSKKTKGEAKSYEINENIFITDFLNRRSARSVFEKGLKPEKILGATNYNDCLYFVFKFHGDEEPYLIVSEEAYQKVPYMVLKFYESRLSWDSEDEN